MNVIVITGDGDASAIGGNHLIHAARRNINITTIVYNNNIYGMTGGQYSPTTPTNEFGTTAPHGNIDKAFDITGLAGAAGATYTAKVPAFQTKQMIGFIKKAIAHNGFSLVETISSCPTYYGRKNKKGDVIDMMKWQKEAFIDKKVYDKLPEEKREGKLIYGEYVNKELPEYTDEYLKIIERLRG